MNAHFDPARDTVLIDNVFVPMHMDPSVRVRGGNTDPGSKIVVDATRSIDAGELSIPSRPLMEKALDSWRRAGLPEIQSPEAAGLSSRRRVRPLSGGAEAGNLRTSRVPPHRRPGRGRQMPPANLKSTLGALFVLERPAA